jgi:hypothetical protein
MFKFVQSTPVGGDCTCGYEIQLDKLYTVKEFVDTVVKEKNKEWGCIGISDGKSIFGSPNCQYRCGELITEQLPDDILLMPVKKASASGGYSRMDYKIDI